MIGLIAGTGLRVGEAIRLTVRDVHLKADPAYLEVLRTKFRKSRLVALHSTTADKLLGHENIQTTHGYIEADLLIKEQALQKLVPAGQPTARF